MKNSLCILILGLLPMLLLAQHSEETNGIRWAEGLSWEQVKQKAKQENKYIFLDCFATWCGPCKLMDKEIYANDTVGSFFNERFISVRVQMDKTQKDAPWIKTWYESAQNIAKDYRVFSFPTYVFLTSTGEIIHKDRGYKKVPDFLRVARTALTPGKVYNKEYEDYDELITQFERGNFDYSKMFYMFESAVKLRQMDEAKKIYTTYLEYLKSLTESELLTKETIDFLGHPFVALSSKSRLFNLFYRNSGKVDAVVNKKGYAKRIIDRIIQREEVTPFIKIKNTGGMIVAYSRPEDIPAAPPEPYWEELERQIRMKYKTDYVKRNVLDAKIRWYEYYHQDRKHLQSYFARIKKYGFDTNKDKDPDLMLNSRCSRAFEQINDSKVLKQARRQMKDLIKRSWYKHPYFHAACLDTYAHLLYKTGKRKEAIAVQENALNQAIAINARQKDIDGFKSRLEKMKKGESIWVEKGRANSGY